MHSQNGIVIIVLHLQMERFHCGYSCVNCKDLVHLLISDSDLLASCIGRNILINYAAIVFPILQICHASLHWFWRRDVRTVFGTAFDRQNHSQGYKLVITQHT